jgi:hypothetical protein
MLPVAYKKNSRVGNVIKLRRRTKYQEQEQVIEKIARSFFCRKKKKELDKQVKVCGEAP